MRYFIHLTIDDFWTALRNDRIIESNLKPSPYKEYRELTNVEYLIMRGIEHYIILLHRPELGTWEERTRMRWQSVENEVVEEFPELAKKHGLKIDRTHEYWRKK